MNCLLCERELKHRLTLKDIAGFGRISHSPLCPECACRFTEISGPRCPACSRMQENDRLCNECLLWKEKYGWVLDHQALYVYNEAMKDFMRRYKFTGDYRLRQAFQVPLHAVIKAAGPGLLVPIPVTAMTMRTRGFNQVEGLVDCRMATGILGHRAEDKVAQSRKSRRERLLTPQPFCLNDVHKVRGQRVILIDDIYTTGRTLYHAAAILRAAGCGEIKSISLAR